MANDKKRLIKFYSGDETEFQRNQPEISAVVKYLVLVFVPHYSCYMMLPNTWEGIFFSHSPGRALLRSLLPSVYSAESSA